ncbi:MAG TPA: SEC-C metal-binding domain-containing protein [Gemmataceae bacterium]|nr:SEC-C metal-binding domain-containing protein [Gemmataceae bacterium]
MAADRVSRNAPCPCGSGRKFKRCCGRAGPLPAGAHKTAAEYPLGTVARYGPDDRTATKLVAAVFTHDGADPILERWVAADLDTNPKVQQECAAFLKAHGVKRVVAAPEILGCPHEEGEDFPEGSDCPFCPFWRGKQGTTWRDDAN